jgi:hypothetical protein
MAGPTGPDDLGDDLAARDRARVEYLSSLIDTGDPAGSQTELNEADRAELDELRGLLADESLWAEPPAELENAIVGLISQEAATRTGSVAEEAGEDSDSLAGFAPGPVDLAAARDRRLAQEGAGTRATSHRRSAGGRRWARPAILVAAAAAVVAVALTAVLVLRNANPERTFAASLSATELMPGAGGTVTMVRTESGWEILLNAYGLPRLDGGEFYEAWMRNEQGTLIPVGTFNEGTDVVLWGGVSPQSFPTFTITRESADGDQNSSGQRVLVGTAVEVSG